MKICCLFLFFLPKILRMRTGIKQRRNNLSVFFFRFVWGYDIRMKHTIGTCQIHWLTYQMIILYKYNIYRRLKYTLRMMINNNVFFFRQDPILYILAWFEVVRLHPHCHSSVFFCFMSCNKKWEIRKFPNFPTNVILRQIK